MAARGLRLSAPVIRLAAPDRLLAAAAPARPAMPARRLRVSVPRIRVALPERLFATAAPAEQPAPTAAARVGRLGKVLEHAVQAIEVGHQAAAALRRVAAARRLTAIAPVRTRPVRVPPLRTVPVRTRPVGVPPVRTVPVGTPPSGAGPPAAGAFFWFGRFALDGAGDDPAPAVPSLAIRIRGLPGRAGRAGYERAPRGLCRRIPPRAIPARHPGRHDPATGRIPSGWPRRGRTAPGRIPAAGFGRPGTASGSGRSGRRGPTARRIPAGRPAPRIRRTWRPWNPDWAGRTAVTGDRLTGTPRRPSGTAAI